MTVGIDGGYLRAAHKEGCFEVIAGRSVVAFRRREEDAIPPPKCFGFVQTYDQKPRRRLWELMKSKGMQENQQVVFLSDGGEDIRQVREYLHPNSEPVIDWFHITMRLTVLRQHTKALTAARPESGAATSKQIESIQHLLWHGNVEEALERLTNLLMDHELMGGSLRTGRKTCGGGWGVRDLHSQQSGIHSELRRVLSAGRNDQHRLRRIDDQSGGQSEVRQETTDALDAPWGAPAFAVPY
jgi:hypothetical protein